MSAVRTPHADSRLPKVLDEAARLFRTRGFEGTSVREIARAVGMLPGSLYCHFETKEALLVAVYVKGVQQITDAVRAAIERESQPWDRLEAACVAHLESILRDDDYAQVVVRVRPADVPVAHASLIELRNQYEALFAELDRRTAAGAQHRSPRAAPDAGRRHEFGADLVPARWPPRHRARWRASSSPCCGRGRRSRHEQFTGS